MVHPYKEVLQSGQSALVVSIIEGLQQISIVALLVPTLDGSGILRFTWRNMVVSFAALHVESATIVASMVSL